MIKSVKAVTILVRDQQRSLEFFRDKIGLRVQVDDHRIVDERWIELTPNGGGGAAIALVAAGNGDKVGVFTNVVFGSENVYNTYRDLKGRGVEFVTGPEEQSWGTVALFKDVDGNVFAIAS